MKVLASKTVEDCLNGVVRKEFRFNEPVTEEVIRLMGRLGNLDYYAHFPKPFYKITRKGQFIIKGVQGNDTCQVVFINYDEEINTDLHDRFNSLTDDS